MMLKVENLNAWYEKAPVLQQISIELKDGECVGLLGRNGAGKTTLFRSILRLHKNISGKILFNGTEITNYSPDKIARLGVSYVPQDNIIFPGLTVMENLKIGTFLSKQKVEIEQMEHIFTLFPRVKELLRRPAYTLSGGERKMVTIARALITKPKLLLMDEPMGGLMPVIVDKLFNYLRSLAKEGTTIFIVEQSPSLILKFVDRVYILEKGMIVYEGSSNHLQNNPEIVNKYLGVAS
jgi:branched-chain amino acid transport system ATP-binding protein